MKLSFGLLTLIAGICLPQSCCLATASDSNIADVPDNENGWTEDTTPILVGGKILNMMHSINGTSNVPNINPMIVGGEDASKGEFKFFVWLNNGKYVCGASLVAPNVVLSAAHCYDDETDFVTLGMYKQKYDDGEAAEFYNIEHIPIAETISHPDYKELNSEALINDYWMIRLQWASMLYSGTNAIMLDTLSDDLVLTSGRELVVMGFGAQKTGGESPNVMQKVVVNYLSNEECVSPNTEYYDPSDIIPNSLCAALPGKDSCQGDSGGPLVDVLTGKQVGVVSFGFGGCANSSYPGVYARVAGDAYTNFIIPHITQWSNPTTRPSNSWVKRLTSTTSEFKLGCTDKGGYYDSYGVNYNCMWYANDLTRCSTSGNTHAGVTAKMACCACGGGVQTTTSSKPTTKPTTKKPTLKISTSKPTSKKPTSRTITTRKPTAKPTAKKPTAWGWGWRLV